MLEDRVRNALLLLPLLSVRDEHFVDKLSDVVAPLDVMLVVVRRVRWIAVPVRVPGGIKRER